MKHNKINSLMIILFILFIPFINNAQENNYENYNQAYIDSLYKQVKELIISSDLYEEGQLLISEGLNYSIHNTYDQNRFLYLQGKLYLFINKKDKSINLFNQIVSQESTSLNSKQKYLIGLCHYELAHYYSEIDSEIKMNYHCQEALKHYESTNFKNINDIYYIQNDYYFYKGNSDSYIFAYKAIINSYKEYIYTIFSFPSYDDLSFVYNNLSISLNRLAIYYESLRKFDSSLTFYEMTDFYVKKDSNNLKENIIISKHNLAYINLRLKNYDKAELLTQGILSTNKELKSPDTELNILTLSMLGDIRLERKDYIQAKIYYDKSMTEAVDFYGKNDSKLEYNYERLAVIHYSLKSYNSTIKHYEVARKLTLNKNGINYLNYTIGIASAYQYINKNKAFEYYKEALELSKNIYGIQKIDSEANIYYNLALLEKKDKSSSIKKHLLSKELYEKSPNNFYESCLNLIALAEHHKKDKNLYIQYLNQAINSTLRKGNKHSIGEVPKYNDIVFPFQLIHCYKTLGNFYYQNNDIDNALATYEKAKKTISIIKPMYKYDASRSSLTIESIPVFNKIVTLSYQKYNATNDFNYFLKAYDAAERSKSIHLIDALNNIAAIDKVGVPDSIIQFGENLKKEIDYLEEEINTTSDIDQSNIIKNDILDLYTEYNEYIIQIENKYPKYHELKYSSKDIDIYKLKKSISQENLIIQYNIQDSLLAILAITKDNESFIIKKINKKDIVSKTQQYREAIIDKDDLIINQLSVDIYNLLLKDIINIYPNKGKIIIIPDEVLNHLPFEILSPTINPESRVIYSKYISYNYSSLSLYKNKEKENSKYNFLGIAPSYIKFPKLPFAKKEIEEINQGLSGKVLIGKEANLNNFKNHLFDYNIIHFAGHAEINDSLPMISRLIFSEKKDSIQNLYAHELYNMKINSNMVVLSACNSGVGQILEGEGNISLARGLAYAGCPSTITTLWPMNDEPTKDIMTSFYKNLKKGYTKSEALRKSKLDYLESGGSKIQDPLYWAGIVIIGSDSPVLQSSLLDSFNPKIFLLVFVLLFIMIFIKFKK